MKLEKEDVRSRIASLLQEHMDIDPALALQDTVFSELHKDFDMEFDGFDRNSKIPTNVSEMADALMREYEQYQLRQAKKNPAPNNQVPESITG